MDSHDQDAPPQEDTPTPDVEAPDTSGQADQPDYFDEKFDPASLDDTLLPAYNQMRAAFTQKTQTVAEQRREIEQERQLLEDLRSDDPNVQSRALSALNLELETEDEEPQDDYEYEDPYEPRFAQIEQILVQQAEQAQQAEQEAAIDSYIEDSLGSLSTKTGVEFDDDEAETLIAQAFANPNDEGLPDFDAAYDRLYVKVLGKQRQRWVQSKQAPQPGSGRSGSPAVSKSTRDQMAEIIAAEMDAT
jgi:hypothetical protein